MYGLPCIFLNLYNFFKKLARMIRDAGNSKVYRVGQQNADPKKR